jgi:acyl-coenzyme A synthetase/AMP-(fatty) acid ligase
VNLLQPFLAEAGKRGTHTAIVAGDGSSVSYVDLLARSARVAAGWRRAGLAAGDRVLLAMPLGLPLYVSLLALWRLGAVIVFPEPALGFKGVRFAAGSTKPKAFLATGWYRLLRYASPELHAIPLAIAPDETAAPAGDPFEQVAAEHPALFSFTSGSTGRPKTIVRSHGFLARQNACVADLLRPGREDEVDLVAFPVFVLANLGLGVTSVLPQWSVQHHDRAKPAMIAGQIARQRVTRLLVPPSICETLADAPAIPGLGSIFTGGGPVFPDLLQRLMARLPQTDIVSVYGSTEAEPIAHQRGRDIGEADWAAMRSGAGLLAGHPVPAIRLEICDDEIVVAGDHVNKGYLDRADDLSTKVRRGGAIWHRTGDAGRLDERGRLWLRGRLDGKSGALFPFGIEAAARYWPGVVRAALVEMAGKPLLAVEGDAGARPRWQQEADRIGAVEVVAVKSIPLDRRHRSKVDYPALRALMAVARQ